MKHDAEELAHHVRGVVDVDNRIRRRRQRRAGREGLRRSTRDSRPACTPRSRRHHQNRPDGTARRDTRAALAAVARAGLGPLLRRRWLPPGFRHAPVRGGGPARAAGRHRAARDATRRCAGDRERTFARCDRRSVPAAHPSSRRRHAWTRAPRDGWAPHDAAGCTARVDGGRIRSATRRRPIPRRDHRTQGPEPRLALARRAGSAATFRAFAAAALRVCPGIACRPATRCSNCAPAGNTPDKGSAVETFLEHLPFRGRRPVFVGDDLTDEHAFEVVNARDGLSVLVGTREPSVARWHLDNPASVRAWIARATAHLRDGVHA